jgi:hypothetical protein
MSIVRCLYCDAVNDAATTAGYCESCGHKLPPASLARRRRIFSPDTPGGAAGEDAPRTGRGTANLFFSAAILVVVAGGLLLVLGPLLAPEPVTTAFLPAVIGVSVLGMLLFAGLGWWALHTPRRR